MCLNLSNLALCGFPFLSGFYSKDLLIEAGLITDLGGLRLSLIVVNVGLTAAYRARLGLVRIIKESNLSPLRTRREEDTLMLSSKRGLAVLAVVVGRGLAWLIFDSTPLTVLTIECKLMALGALLVGGVVGAVIVFRGVVE